jgi:ribosome hibernation promoting factor
MTLRIAGKNFDIGQALRSRIDETVAGTVEKYFTRGYSGQVTVSKSGHVFETDLALHLDTGVVFEVHGSDADAHQSFDQAAERLAKRLRRYKRRLVDH